MTDQEIESKVIELVVETMNVSDPAEVSRETHFINDLEADSLENVELMMRLEETFQLKKISDEELQDIQTVGAAIDFVKVAPRESDG